MSTLRVLAARLAGTFRRRRSLERDDADLRAELESHVAMHAEENIRRGMSAEDAWRDARVASGGITQAAELSRDQRSLPWLERTLDELRHALRVRVLIQHPGFSATVIISLGVGISCAAAVFAVVDSARHAKLPFRDVDRIEHLYLTSRASPDVWMSDVPSVVARALVQPGSPVEQVAAYHTQSFQVRDRDRMIDGWSVYVTDNFLTMLGQRAIVGRVFGPNDRDRPSVVLSRKFWQAEFGGDSAVVGRTLEMGGVAYTVVGIAAPETAFPEFPQMWVSGYDPSRLDSQRNMGLGILALRRADVPREVARARISSIGGLAIAAQGGRASKSELHSASMREYLLKGRMAGVILLLTIIAVFVGFLTAVNFAALTLARGIRRRAELGVRAALGASVPRLVRHVIGECLVLCALAGLLAAVLAPLTLDLLHDRFAGALPVWLELSLSWRTIASSVGLTVAIGVVFGLGPALDLARPALLGFLRTASSTVSESAGLARTRSWLVAIQVSMATMVLVALGATFGPAFVVGELDSGFDPRPLIRASVRYVGVADPVKLAERGSRLLAESRALPGVADAAYHEFRFFSLSEVTAIMESGTRTAEEAGLTIFESQRVSEGYFNVVRPRLIAGRLPTVDEERSGAPVAVVTKIVAQRMFDGHAVGKRLTLERSGTGTVIGVIDDIREHLWQPDASPLVLSPVSSRYGAARGGATRTLLLRSSGPVARTLRLLRERSAVQRLDDGRVFGFESVADIMQQELAAFHQVARLILTIFAVALGLAALGIYGLVAYTAEMRSRELAIREALGALRLHVARRVLQGAVLQTLAGVIAGSILATAVIDYLSEFHLRLTLAVGASTVALGVLALTVLLSSIGPLVAAWRRDISFTLRAGG